MALFSLRPGICFWMEHDCLILGSYQFECYTTHADAKGGVFYTYTRKPVDLLRWGMGNVFRGEFVIFVFFCPGIEGRGLHGSHGFTLIKTASRSMGDVEWADMIGRKHGLIGMHIDYERAG